jgi:hypothetical protein
LVQPSPRRNKRIAAKGKGLTQTAIKRAQRIPMHKIGLCRDEERLSAAELDEYSAIFGSPLGPEQVGAIAALFGLSCGPGGEVDFVEAQAS